jgi:8-oxo-dGTP pyrophosphatase MutT (NUDIX family)
MDTDAHRLVMLYESMKNKRRVSKVVIINNNKILLMQKNGNLKWELPGGHVKPKEDMLKGACREVREETGIKLDSEFLKKIDSSSGNDYKCKWYRYDLPVKQKIKMSDEHVNYKWVPKNKLDNYELSDSTNHLAIVSSYDG